MCILASWDTQVIGLDKNGDPPQPPSLVATACGIWVEGRTLWSRQSLSLPAARSQVTEEIHIPLGRHGLAA